MFLLVCKSDTTIGVPVGTHSEIPEELWEHRELVEITARDSLAWYAGLEGAELVGPVRWWISMVGSLMSPPIEEGAWE